MITFFSPTQIHSFYDMNHLISELLLVLFCCVQSSAADIILTQTNTLRRAFLKSCFHFDYLNAKL